MAVLELYKILNNEVYVYDYYTTKLRSILEDVAKNGDILDLKDCRFGPACVGIIREFYPKVNFINSMDEGLNFILEHNMRASKMRSDTIYYPVESIEYRFESPDPMMNYLKRLKEKCTTEPKTRVLVDVSRVDNRFYDKVYPMAVIITLKLPQVKLKFGRSKSYEFFQYCRQYWTWNENISHDSYMENVGDCFIRRDKKDGKFRLPLDGYYTEEALAVSKRVMPAEFGEKVLYKDEEYSRLCNESLERVCSRVGNGKRMIDFINMEEN